MPGSITQFAILLLLLGSQALAGPTPHIRRSCSHKFGKRACAVKANSTVPVLISPSDASAAESATSSAIGQNLIGHGQGRPSNHGWYQGSSNYYQDPSSTAQPPASSVVPDAAGYSSIPLSSALSSNIPSSAVQQPGSGITISLSADVPSISSATSADFSTSLLISSSSSSLPVTASALAAVPPVSGTNSSVSLPAGSPTGKHVFAHFMVGIVSTYAQGDWEKDMNLARSKEITGFALNIGKDPYSQAQLDLAYAAASTIPGGFELFISFDFNWYSISDVGAVAQMLGRYVNHPQQLKVDGKPFVSTFIGDGFDWAAVEKQIGVEIYSLPFYQPTAEHADTPALSGLFSWAAWPGQLNNQPVKSQMTTDRDLLYMGFTEAVDKQYMAPVSPWFFTHFGKEVPYSKNWLFYSETLWYDRWEQILKLGNRLKFLEIVTWNDYGESHYIGPYDTPHTDDGSSRWTKGFDHSGSLDFAVPYIKAFKAGLSAPVIEQDMLIYWYRPHLKSANCDATDNCLGKPDGWDMVADEVFIATMTKNGGSFTLTSGGNAPFTQTAGPGVQMFSVPMGVGSQIFSFEANGAKGSDTGSIAISADCWNGIYNFNYHSGSIKL